jgi:predicted RNA-binding Zn ribbon-like protein
MTERSIENLQLDGGCSVFDFTNTINTRTSTAAFDYLTTYDEILSWSHKAGLLVRERIKLLSQYAAEHPEQRDIAFVKAIRVRETLYQLFSPIAKNKTPNTKILNEYNAILSECLSKLQLQVTSTDATANFKNDTVSLDEPLCIIIKSSYDILTSENFRRLKECPRCGWLFVDRTKNGKRRWCDMKVCGSKDKATRYYHRKKDEAD